MLTRKLLIAAGVLAATLLTCSETTYAQNDVLPPSQRYEPLNVQQPPPSVHIAPGNTSRLNGNSLRSGEDIDLVTWQQDAVPQILSGQSGSASKTAARRTIERFASQVDQGRVSGPKVDPRLEYSRRKTQSATPGPGVQLNVAPPAVKPQPKSTAFSVKPEGGQARPMPQPAVAQRPAVQKPAKFDAKVRLASQEVDANPTRSSATAANTTAAGSLQVETFGPKSIGINKVATFRVDVTNNSSISAKDIRVNINLPQWVDLQNINLTTGQRELANNPDQPRMVWTIGNVPAGKTHSATITAIPSKAEIFNLDVEWTLVPRTGTVNIQVTEPKLEMYMSGPNDVLYGEIAEYQVTIRNQGTGTAENVTVMLPEEFGGDREVIGDIGAGKEMVFDIELAARTAGKLTLTTSASADGNISSSVEQEVSVRRAKLGIDITGPAFKYSGTSGVYKITVNNTGDATGNDLRVALALPQGAEYVGGVTSVEKRDGSVVWPIGSLTPNQTRTFEVECVLNGSGEMQVETGVVGKGDVSAAAACITSVETVADLVLSVQDPKGPLPTGEETRYQITVQNRGSRSAKQVELLMQFSDGIEPNKASGLPNKIVPGQVVFTPIDKIDPGQTMTFEVTAIASKRGTHIFRAFLSCEEADSREVAEGTTKFFGEDIESNEEVEAQTAQKPQPSSGDFRR